MCGRARVSMSAAAVVRAAGVPPERWVDAEAYAPRYNAAPGCVLPVLRLAAPATTDAAATEATEQGASDAPAEATEAREAPGAPNAPNAPRERQLHSMRWGLVPSWTKRDETPDFYRMFNARADTAPDKPIFARLLARRRCVVLMNGFYEWRQEGNKAAGLIKQPYYLHADGADDDDTLLRAAGLYDCWAGPDDSGKPMYTCAILTTDASAQLRWLHDRMPVFLRSEADERAWLVRVVVLRLLQVPRLTRAAQEGGASPVAVLREVSRPEAGPPLAWHPVSTRLNKGAAVEGPQCCAPAPREAERGAGSVAALFAKAQPRAAAEAEPREQAEATSPGAAAATTPAKRAAAQPSPASDAKRAKTATKHTPPPKGQRSVAAFFAKS